MSDGEAWQEAREGAHGRPKERIETGEMRAVGRTLGNRDAQAFPGKGQSAGRNLTIFKSLVLAVLVVITLYGMLNRGLAGTERWLPVAAAVPGLVVLPPFVGEHFAELARGSRGPG